MTIYPTINPKSPPSNTAQVCLDFDKVAEHKNNDVTKAEHRMKVHVFCNIPSPFVAMYSLKKVLREGAQKHGTDAQHFMERHFYVDDGLIFV